MESDGTQGQERLTDIAHVGNVCLELARGEQHTELAIVVHVTRSAAETDRPSRDAGNVGRCVADPCIRVPNADGVRLAFNPHDVDVNIVTATGEAATGGDAQRGVEAAGRVAIEGTITDGRVGVASGVVRERKIPMAMFSPPSVLLWSAP